MYQELIERISNSFRNKPYLTSLDQARKAFTGKGWYVFEITRKNGEMGYHLYHIKSACNHTNSEWGEEIQFEYDKYFDIVHRQRLETHIYSRIFHLYQCDLRHRDTKFKRLDSKSLYILKQMFKSEEIIPNSFRERSST